MATPKLDRIAATGNKPSMYPVETYAERYRDQPDNNITCADGYTLSVIAGFGTYCAPRPGEGGVPDDYAGPFSAVEVLIEGDGELPVPEWAEYGGPGGPEDVYGRVPVDLVRALIEAHGGERP